MKVARLARPVRFALGLVFFLGGLNGGLNAAPAPPPAPVPSLPPALVGKIAHIRIIGSVNIPANTIQAVLTQKVGDFYSPAAAEKDRAAIKDMGVFNDPVTVSAASAPGGVDLDYTVSEYPVIKSIRFTADTPTKEPTVPAATLLALMKTRPGQVLNTKVLVSDLDALFNHDTGYVRKQGYLFDVSSDLNLDPPTGVLTIPVVEGHIQSIQITGNTRVKTVDILAQMHAKPGDLYDDKVLQKDLGAIYEMGGFKEVQNWTFTGTAPGQIMVTIPVVEHEAAQGTLDEKQGKVVPFLYHPLTDPVPVVEVSINGRHPLPFLLDTGTSPALSLDLWAAKALGLKPSGPAERSGNFVFTPVPVREITLQGLGHGNDVSFNTPDAVIINLSAVQDFPGPHIAGIIGIGAFGSLTTRFDFAAKTLTVFAYPHPPLDIPGGTVLPLMTTSGGTVTARATFAPDAFADLVIDTGSSSTQVPLSALKALHPTAIAFNHLYERLDGVFVCPSMRLPGLTLGALRVPDVTMGTLPPPTMTSLGMDILAGYRLTLDGPNGQAILQPSARGGRYLTGWSGIDLKQTPTGWSVSSIRDKSPAQRSGLHVGDELVTIDGVRIKGFGETKVKYLLGGIVGSPLRLSVRRTSGKEVAVSWVPLDEFSEPRDALYGLTLHKVNGGPWLILDIMQGCPGDRAGLQVGDEITRMNGALTAPMPLNQSLKLMEQASKSITLSVQRAGRAEPFTVKLSAPPAPVSAP